MSGQLAFSLDTAALPTENSVLMVGDLRCVEGSAQEALAVR
ncbi:hypothetical protein [Pseudomonas sp. dw_358]|nr:hypothetical protein [Pseudomonas sp. dw_358]